MLAFNNKSFYYWVFGHISQDYDRI